MPTPIHMDSAIISVVIGKDSDTAVRAFSLTWDTNMQSTKLYVYCINMEHSGGMLMLNISESMGAEAILFCPLVQLFDIEFSLLLLIDCFIICLPF